MDTITITEIGCYLDNHRGHYITRDAIEFAEEHGFILGSFEKFALIMYEEHNHESEYPYESLIELCDEAVNWLNSGQSECGDCDGTGKGIEGRNNYYTHKDRPDVKLCKKCSGTGRGDRIKMQNFPPKVPEHYMWSFNDGDFGLYRVWSYDKDDTTYDAPCDICDEGPLELKGQGGVCPNGHINEGI